MCLVWISEQTAIICYTALTDWFVYLNIIHFLVFITETYCVYCTILTESLNIIQVKFIFQ
jgi:hypothetical protein